MNLHTRRFQIQGPAGTIEMLRDEPGEGAALRGTAVIAHPHPLFGGTMENKVVQTLARAFVQSGWRALRFNFRGVGASQGEHDEGRGELEDLHAVVKALAPQSLVLAGFSFGASLQARLAQRVNPAWLVLVGIGITRLEAPSVPEGSLVIHGENDDTVPLAAVLDWARPQELPVLVVPGAEHYFHRKLHILKRIVLTHAR